MPSPQATTLDEFQVLVEEALQTLPASIQDKMHNVAILVAEFPSPAQLRAIRLGPGYALYGLYEGVPLTERTSNYGMVSPDRITIFMHPMVEQHPSPQSIREQVRRTVVHEIGHHFGMGEKQLRALGY